MNGWIFAGALGATVLMALPLGATPAARIQYTLGAGTETCADDESLRRAVSAQLGYDPFRENAALAIVASVSEKNGIFHGRVEVRNAPEPPRIRDLDSRDCAALLSAMALTIGVAIDPLTLNGPPSSVSTAPPSAPPETAKPSAPTGNEATVNSANREPDLAQDPPRFQASLGGHAALGAAPLLSAGIDGGVAVRWLLVSLSLEGRVNLPSTARLSSGGDVVVSLQMGRFVPCVRRGLLVACVLAGVGAIRAGSERVTNPRADVNFYADVGVRAGLEIPISETFAVRPQIDLVAPLTRPTIYHNGVGFWTVPALSGALGGVFLAKF